MDEEEKIEQNRQQEDQSHTPFDQTSQVTDKAKKIGKKAISSLRGAAGAGAQAGEAAAGTEALGGAAGAAAAGTEAAEAGVAATAATTETATSAAGAAVASAGSSMGAYALVTVVLILFIMTVMIAILGNPQTTRGTEISQNPVATPSGSINPTISLPPVNCQEADDIFKEHNIAVSSINSCSKRVDLARAIQKLYSYSGFSKKMGEGEIKIESNSSSSCGGPKDRWYGCTSGNKITLKNFELSSPGVSYWNYIITHEFFHILNHKAWDYYKEYDYPYLLRSEPDCFDNGVFKTYELRRGGKSESFAESGAVFVTGRGGTGSFPNLVNRCPGNYLFWNQKL